jgi:hypothetical protein
MSKAKGKAQPKVEEVKPVVVEVKEPEPEPEPVVVEEKDPFPNSNQQRVIFPKLPVKQIVSYHSSTILANDEPTIELSDEKYDEIKSAYFAVAIDGAIKVSDLVDLLAKLGSDYDRTILQKIIDQKLIGIVDIPGKISEGDSIVSPMLSENQFVQFFLKFYAPAYYYGQRLRMYAGRGELDQVKELIIRQCNINSANGEGLTALHYACESNNLAVIDLLVELGGEKLLVNPQDKHGWTPLHCAAHHGNTACVSKLISLKADVNIDNNVGKTALHLACAQNRGAIVNVLLAAGASLTHQDRRGHTPLHDTAYRGRLGLFQELIRDARADLSLKDDLGKVANDYLGEENA